MNKALKNTLQLAQCPLSNQEVEWLKDEPEFAKEFSESGIYMIAQRKRIGFCDYSYSKNDRIFTFRLKIGNVVATDNLTLDLSKILNGSEEQIECGSYLFRVTSSVTQELIVCLTPDKLLYEHSKSKINVNNLSSDWRMKSFKIHYIGKSEKRSSLDRLFGTPHSTRCRILSNEHPFLKEERLTDELMILFFKIGGFEMSSFGIEAEVKDVVKSLDNSCSSYKDRFTSYVEKALIKILQPQYNEIKYANFPTESDIQGVDSAERSVITIGEEITLFTAKEKIYGSREEVLFKSDSICVDFETKSTILKKGVR
jgi:hypothetical protein